MISGKRSCTLPPAGGSAELLRAARRRCEAASQKSERLQRLVHAVFNLCSIQFGAFGIPLRGPDAPVQTRVLRNKSPLQIIHFFFGASLPLFGQSERVMHLLKQIMLWIGWMRRSFSHSWARNLTLVPRC
jgi:hypothetical protein